MLHLTSYRREETCRRLQQIVTALGILALVVADCVNFVFEVRVMIKLILGAPGTGKITAP